RSLVELVGLVLELRLRIGLRLDVVDRRRLGDDGNQLLFVVLRLLGGIIGARELNADSLLGERRDDHEDDEEDEGDIHEWSDVDVALDLTAAARSSHAHGWSPLRSTGGGALSATPLDEVVEKLRSGVRHLDLEPIDLVHEVVVDPDGRDGDE